jgi:magnesium chelatase family protein
VPCGYAGDPRRHCPCPPNRKELYRQKLSGPLLRPDRSAARRAARLSKGELLGESPGESSPAVARAGAGRAGTAARAVTPPSVVSCNGQLPGPLARRQARLSASAEALLAKAVESARAHRPAAFDRALKVARTIADLAGAEQTGADTWPRALSLPLRIRRGETSPVRADGARASGRNRRHETGRSRRTIRRASLRPPPTGERCSSCRRCVA